VNNQSQFLKGTLEGGILKIISKNETYGYEIVQKVNQSGLLNISEGTLYPILIRLEKKGLIKSILRKSPLGPMRKYYVLTDEGQDELSEFIDSWQFLKKSIDSILED
jgi:PadR family transcriptional regulator PadR